jgi:hypothetical protein
MAIGSLESYRSVQTPYPTRSKEQVGCCPCTLASQGPQTALHRCSAGLKLHSSSNVVSSDDINMPVFEDRVQKPEERQSPDERAQIAALSPPRLQKVSDLLKAGDVNSFGSVDDFRNTLLLPGDGQRAPPKAPSTVAELIAVSSKPVMQASVSVDCFLVPVLHACDANLYMLFTMNACMTVVHHSKFSS